MNIVLKSQKITKKVTIVYDLNQTLKMIKIVQIQDPVSAQILYRDV